MAHDEFVASALKGIGYNTRSMECADIASLRFGKEFGNKAQCNPTYFTVGNLVKELSRLRDEEGLSAQDIIDFARDRLAHFKCPKTVEFGELPKTATGKIQKFRLRERAAASRSDEDRRGLSRIVGFGTDLESRAGDPPRQW